jgi:hypothetical protein
MHSMAKSGFDFSDLLRKTAKKSCQPGARQAKRRRRRKDPDVD